MPPPRRAPEEDIELYRRERRSQIRGLLILVAILLLLILLRADRKAIFHPGWWRI